MIQTRIKFSDEAKEVFAFLAKESLSSKKEKMIFNAVCKKIELIKTRPFYGNTIAKELIPKYYKEKYDAKNLLRVELPCFWRMLYTLKEGENEITIIAFILDIIDHKDYDKKFSYRKK